eukprot:SM000014S00303  [mRNA]  locus=s14:509489:513197:- [translate_table: standard]
MSERRGHGLALLVATVAGAEAGFIMRKGGAAEMALLDWLASATASGPESAGAAAEAWPRLLSVPAASRAEAFRDPRLLLQVLQAVLLSASLPPGFTSWEESELDQDVFLRFREASAADTLAVLCRELGVVYVTFLGTLLASPASWQQAEVALFAMAAASSEALELERGGEAVEVRPCLAMVFAGLPGAAALAARDAAASPHHMLVATTLQFMEKFAPFAAENVAALEAGLKYVMSALCVRPVAGRAAWALRALCLSSTRHLAAGHIVASLIEACEQAVAEASVTEGGSTTASDEAGGLGEEDQVAIAEALATVAVGLPSEEAAKSALLRIVSPAFAIIQQLTTAQPQGAGNRKLAGTWRLVAAVVAASGKSPPSLGAEGQSEQLPVVLLRQAWLLAEHIAATRADDREVSAAVCTLWGAAAHAAGAYVAPLLPQVIENARIMFVKHHHADCIRCLQEVLHVQLEEDGLRKAVAASLAVALTTVAGELPALQQQQAVEAGPSGLASGERQRHRGSVDVHQAICKFAQVLLTRDPSTLLTSPSFLPLLQCGVGCLRMHEVEVAKAAAHLMLAICEAAGGSSLPADLALRAQDAVSNCAQAIVQEILRAVAVGSALNEAVIAAMADVLRVLCQQHREATRATMISAMEARDFPVGAGVLSSRQKQLLAVAATKQPPHPKRRYQEMFLEFSRVCQGQAQAESLEWYADQ